MTTTPHDAMLCAGCSALSWHTEDGKHLWGRNLDFNRLAEGTMVTFFPTGTIYRIFGTENPSGTQEIRRTARYAAAGMGLYPTSGIAILYEGINSQGLMGGQLYYRTLAHYSAHCRPGTTPIQPPFLVYHLLAQCATVEEVVQVLRKELTLVDRPFWGTAPPLHWTFSDRTGESIVVEPDEDGLHIHRSTIGVMTNSPDYRWHRLNLLNYAGIRDLDHDGLCICGDSLTQCFSGSGAQGLPGDWSSPARFVRLALLKEHCLPGKDEASGIAAMLHLFQSAAFPLGMIRVSQPGHITEQDSGVVPFDYTVYTSIMCAESLRYYWTTYENQRVQCIDLHHLSNRDQPVQFPLGREPDFLYLTGN